MPKLKHEDQYVVQLIAGISAMDNHPELLAHVGKFVTDYKPERAPYGKQWLWTTENVDEALGFNSMIELHALYRTSVGTRSWDGRPDRPITAYHVQIGTRQSFIDGDGLHGWKPKMLEGD